MIGVDHSGLKSSVSFSVIIEDLDQVIIDDLESTIARIEGSAQDPSGIVEIISVFHVIAASIALQNFHVTLRVNDDVLVDLLIGHSFILVHGVIFRGFVLVSSQEDVDTVLIEQ